MADPEFVLLGDATWLDFINTVPAVPSALDSLPDAAAYHRWTKASKLVSDADHVSLEEIRGFRSQLAYLAAALTEDRQPRSWSFKPSTRFWPGPEATSSCSG